MTSEKSIFFKFGPKCDFRGQKALVKDFHPDLEKKLNVLADCQQKCEKMLKMLYIFEFWSKLEFFHFWVKFGAKLLAALGKRLYPKIGWESESITLKLSEDVFNLFFGLIAAEKIGIKVLSYKKRRFLYKKSSRKRGVHDMFRHTFVQKKIVCKKLVILPKVVLSFAVQYSPFT